jgi:ribosomal protein S6--L-glutamate ligase
MTRKRLRVAVAGIPGAWSTERMAESLRARGVDASTFSAGDLVHDLTSGRVELHGEDLSRVDGIVVKKLADQSSPWGRLRLHALRVLESRGVRIFSRPDVIDVAMDRYRMTVEMAAAGLPVPATISAETEGGLRDAIARLGDSVVKPVYTSKGRGMIRVDADGAAILDGALDADGQRYLVQQFVRAPGRDIGATVSGGAFVGAFYRVAADGAWMTTTSQGGRYERCELSAEGIELAERAAQLFRLDYTVVDLVEQERGFLIYEVSAFGGFRGLLEATGVDPSVAYAEHVVRELGG